MISSFPRLPQRDLDEAAGRQYGAVAAGIASSEAIVRRGSAQDRPGMTQ
jgi:hypothetical protein